MTTNLEVPTLTGAAAYGLNTYWLDQSFPVNTTATNYLTTSGCAGTWTNGMYWYYPVTDHRPIKLGLSEVEKLRSAAKRDAKLKKILEKFTDQIEVVVDFK